MVQYGSPRRLNLVSVTLILIVGGVAYWFWRFFPVYFDAWSVDHILKETANATYQTQKLYEAQRMEQLKVIADNARDRIVNRVGILDPELTVNLNIDGDLATVSADYSVVVTHPWVGKTTTMRLHRVQTANLKFVKWD
jgi:hypothetical protein